MKFILCDFISSLLSVLFACILLPTFILVHGHVLRRSDDLSLYPPLRTLSIEDLRKKYPIVIKENTQNSKHSLTYTYWRPNVNLFVVFKKKCLYHLVTVDSILLTRDNRSRCSFMIIARPVKRNIAPGHIAKFGKRARLQFATCGMAMISPRVEPVMYIYE